MLKTCKNCNYCTGADYDYRELVCSCEDSECSGWYIDPDYTCDKWEGDEDDERKSM